jgi:hypothetical protein
MNDEPPSDHDEGNARRRKRGASPIRLKPPKSVPINDEDYQRAVTVLASMITCWWERQHDRRPEAEE